MGINQAIYTSSARGIDKGGGMGIHTYNRNCSMEELKEFELSYCQYAYSGDPGMIPQLPVKLLYGKTDSGHYMQACVAYIGKDYDKVRGRMGNFISHMYSFSKDSLTGWYPIELYGSAAYRTSMKQEEVDGSMPVDYLPEVRTLKKGKAITVTRVQDFLNQGRLEMFCHLMAAVLHRDQLHKIIIYDTHEHILLWLGAVQFALPLQCAKEVTFSSYEPDPRMSEFYIRGAVAGLSKGSCGEYAANGQFHVFDGIHGEYPKFDVSQDYFQLGIQMALSYSYDSLLGFFEYMKRYRYEKVDMDLLSGFKLHQMTQGGMERLGDKEFRDAVAFEMNYGSLASYGKMLVDLIERLEGSENLDQKLLDHICSLLSGYFKKELARNELEFALGLLVRLEQCMVDGRYDKTATNKMWLPFYEVMAQFQEKHTEINYMFMRKEGIYHRLGGFQSYLLQTRQNAGIKEVEKIFLRDWGHAPLEAYRCFDMIVAAAASMLDKQEDGQAKLEAAIDLFLWLQDAGKGKIAGKGCEQLISIMERLTQVSGKKQFVKKRKTDERKFKQRMKCAVEVQNYCNLSGKRLPVTKIRLWHFGHIVARAYEEGRELTKVGEFLVYASCPVALDDISRVDLENYISQLVEIMEEMITATQEYKLIFSCLEPNDLQKETILRVFLDDEMNYFRKDKEVRGVGNLLQAVMESGDAGYQKALEKYVSGMKPSQKEKIADAIRGGCGRELLAFWKKAESAKAGKEAKRGIFLFGRK